MTTHKINNSHTVGGVKYTLHSEDGVHMVRVVNICDLMDHLYPDGWYGVDYMTSGVATKKWCDENESHYYAAPREDFFMFVAVQETLAEGKDVVVVEDLS
jgi:hypothetical protein|tara:strand:+ start:606 stop:905 length:300 start_codon:yes stop_codon:yes gene_type:complete